MERSIQTLRKLNIACGPKHHRSRWWNVDLRPFPGVDEVMDAVSPWPHSGLSHVYAEHFLEHLRPLDALTFLRNAIAALAVGGRIRLSTPGLEWVMHTHFTFETDADQQVYQTFATNRAFHGWGHQFLYSRVVLSRMLKSVGFGKLAFFAYGESGTPEFVDIEQHGGHSTAGGYPSVWIIEGERCSAEIVASSELEEALREHFARHVEGGH